MKPSEEDILQWIDNDSLERKERVRMMLMKSGRRDLLAEFDGKMRDIATGVDCARITWNALSEAQRRALCFASTTAGTLHRFGKSSYTGSWVSPAKPVGLRTVRNLIARELLACDGGAFDPEKVLVLTERGRFVLEFGPSPPSKKEEKG